MTDDPRRHLIEIAIEPKSRSDQEKLAAALQRLTADDASIGVSIDSESGQTILAADGLGCLKLVIERMRHEFMVEANFGQPQVAYRETLGQHSTIDYTHKKLAGAGGEFARVKIVFQPLEPGEGEVFENTAPESNVPARFVAGVERGVRAAAESGVLAGFPVIDYKATLIDGAYHDVDSSVTAFEIAARAAFREAGRSVKAMLLEPIVEFEFAAPTAATDKIRNDVRKRRGEICDVRADGDATTFVGEAPLVNMFDAERDLSRLAGAEVSVDMRFLRYQPVRQIPPTDGPDDVFPPAVGMRA